MMYRWGNLGTLVVAGLCAASASGALLAQQGRYLPGEIEGGGRLYSASCTGCHGPEGDGVAAVNFSKGQFRRGSSDEDLGRIIVSGIPGTRAAGQFPGPGRRHRGLPPVDSRVRRNDGGRRRRARPDGVRGQGQCLTCHGERHRLDG
jgi:mono/diheme cytochrome c family protein